MCCVSLDRESFRSTGTLYPYLRHTKHTFFQKNLLLRCLSLYDCYFKYIVKHVMITSPALGTHSWRPSLDKQKSDELPEASISFMKSNSQKIDLLSLKTALSAPNSSADHSQPFSIAINDLNILQKNLHWKQIKIAHNRNPCQDCCIYSGMGF